MVIKVFVSRTCGNRIMHYQQQHIRRILECKQIEFEEVDISDPQSREDRSFMQSALRLTDSDLVTLPPQIFKQHQYRGDYEGFFRALECEYLYKYLDLTAPPSEVEHQHQALVS